MNKKNILLVSLILFFSISLLIALNASLFSYVSAQENQNYYLPLFTHYEQPLASNSYYMITVDDAFLYNLGCEIGTRDQITPDTQDSVSVLDFSYPICEEALGFGAELFGYGPVPLNDIENAVKNFARGYYACTGSDNDSNLIIGVGTNNKPFSCDTEDKAVSHGAAWGEMVNRINQWSINEGIFQQVQAYGASDIEVGWNSPEWSRAWLEGYDQINQYPLIHFGDAAGCPYSEDSTSTSCGAGWLMEDVWYVSWGAPASLPLPLIYRTDGIQAQQWAHLSRYSVSEHGSAMGFTGVFTQSQACEQWGCNGTDNTPSQAYEQMKAELDKYPSTAQELRWKTDIRWILSSEISRSGTIDSLDEYKPSLHPIMDEIEQLQSTLQNRSLNPLMQNSLEEKLQLLEAMSLNIEASKQIAAPKTINFFSPMMESPDPAFKTGILPIGMIAGLPYSVTINNTWQTLTDEGYLQIAAGSSTEDPNQGTLYILITSWNKTKTKTFEISAPENSGLFEIIKEGESGLIIQADDGSTFILDLETFSLQPHFN